MGDVGASIPLISKKILKRESMLSWKAYWWEARQSNFGDALTPVILNHFTKQSVQWVAPADAEIVVTGSILHSLPQTGYKGIVAGTGKLYDWELPLIDLTRATVLGLRGPLTESRVLLGPDSNHILGDPGLLGSELVATDRGKYGIGVVPHLTDYDLYPRELIRARKYGYTEPKLIDTSQHPLKVIAEIGSFERIVASSLHGLIVADSFGIPRRAEKFAKMDTDIYEGGTFKFDDYGLSIGQPITWGKLQTAPRDRIESIQSDLFDMFQTLARMDHVV